jgi:hypothetical protein
MLSSQEIKLLITALGAGIGTEDKDLERLRYHTIILMCDADVDGAHIRTLLLTFFYRHFHEIIERGHLFIAQPPLYRVKRGKAQQYLKDEPALEDYLIDLASGDVVIQGQGGPRLTGTPLKQVVKKSMHLDKLLDLFERKGRNRHLLTALARQGGDVGRCARRRAEAPRDRREGRGVPEDGRARGPAGELRFRARPRARLRAARRVDAGERLAAPERHRPRALPHGRVRGAPPGRPRSRAGRRSVRSRSAKARPPSGCRTSSAPSSASSPPRERVSRSSATRVSAR